MYTQGGRTIDQLQLHELVDVPLAVVDVSNACSADPDHQVPGFYLVLGGSWVAVSGCSKYSYPTITLLKASHEPSTK